ncbi:MAG: hypothetical protein Q3X49_02370 [Slackia sp.]|uniref:hypothetical protein n=1 Tax=Slackia sp. TaxID=2049041 RepID=UPI00284CD426|nr:hypothetical protein [Slackia sp.]MDR3899932.1 hypothetical protein [Slackia sp.]
MKHFKTESVRPRIALGRIVATVAALCLATALCACAGSAAKSSASKISVNEAMGETYQAALEAAHDKAADAKLLAIRSSSYSSEDAPSQWMYLFYSLDRAYAYTVFVSDGQATVADSGPMSISPQDFDAIPDASAIRIDADDAWNTIVESMDGDDEICTARIFLMTYIKGDEDPTHDAMKWFFSLNESDNLASLFGNGQNKPDNTPALLFAVDCGSASVEELDASELATE